jgi:hypothetical protein
MCSFFFILLIIGSACQEKTRDNQKGFKTFEMAYTNGWTKSFELLVDSNKIYFIPDGFKIKYGILPDSVFDKVNALCQKLKSTQSIITNRIGCIDCAIISVEVVNKGDTIKFTQTDNMGVFLDMINSVQEYVDSNDHHDIRSGFFLHEFETYWKVHPMPPPAPTSN